MIVVRMVRFVLAAPIMLAAVAMLRLAVALGGADLRDVVHRVAEGAYKRERADAERRADARMPKP